MKKRRFVRTRKKAACILNLPEDVMLDLSRITMIGKNRVYVDRHKGLVGYSLSEVVIALEEMTAIIRGEELMLDLFENDRIVISGQIGSVEYGAAV